MNIDSFTLGELKQISAIVNQQITQPSQTASHPFVGKYCIARCYSAGVHAGEVVSFEAENVILKNSRRLWSWKANAGIALSGVAQTGVQDGCKIDALNPEIALTGVCELIPCSNVAMESINGSKK